MNKTEAVNNTMSTDHLQLPAAPPAPTALAALTGCLREQPAMVIWLDENGFPHAESYGCYDAALEIAKQLEYLCLGHADRIILADNSIIDGPLLRREIEGHA